MKKITIYSREKPIPQDKFSRMYEILDYSFPKSERRDRNGHLSEFEKTPFRSLISEDGYIQGFMNFWDLSEFVYLEHFAVAKELRGNGLGAELMKELQKLADNRPIILEVEPPALNETAQRRVKFYERLGFILNKYEYIQPPYRNEDAPMPLMIMSTEKKLSTEEYLNARNAIYRNVYDLPEASELYR